MFSLLFTHHPKKHVAKSADGSDRVIVRLACQWRESVVSSENESRAVNDVQVMACANAV